MSEDLVEVQVDAEKCIGIGNCEMLEPEVFLLNDDTGVASTVGTRLLSSERAEKVVAGCPSGSLSIRAAK